MTKVCDSLPKVLEELGFGIDYNDEGDIVGLSYDSKTGDEDVFLNALARSSRRVLTSSGRGRTTTDGLIGSS